MASGGVGGVPLILLAMVLAYNNDPADLMVDGRGQVFAVTDGQGKIALSPGSNWQSFTENTWLRRHGQEVPSGSSDLHCDQYACLFRRAGYLTSIIYDPLALATDCQVADVVVNLTFIHYPCNKPELVIGRFDLLGHGTVALTFGPVLQMKTVKEVLGNRIWS